MIGKDDLRRETEWLCLAPTLTFQANHSDHSLLPFPNQEILLELKIPETNIWRHELLVVAKIEIK